jgi:pilus assembly protein FimV
MHRLLQADVGAGKTAIAIYALLVAVANGHQAVLMTPTELLSTQEMELGQHAAPASPGLDFNLDFDNKPAPTDKPSMDMAFDMDMGMADATPAMQKTSGLDMDFSLAAPTAEPSSNLIDFNTPGLPESPAGMDFSASDTLTGTDNSLDFSVGGEADTEISTGAGSESPLPGWDETTTKLDLAKAYIDMGDAEGARSILDEVMAEGNDSQKRQAQDLAAQIAA